MTPAQRRYLAIEALIGAAISAILSAAFVLLLFGGRSAIPVAGPTGLLVDAVPQGFAIALMATLVPTWLTRQRLERGVILPLASTRARPPMKVARAIAVGALGAGATVALTALLLATGRDAFAFASVFVGKTLWGFLLGGSVAAVMTHAALSRHGGPYVRS